MDTYDESQLSESELNDGGPHVYNYAFFQQFGGNMKHSQVHPHWAGSPYESSKGGVSWRVSSPSIFTKINQDIFGRK